MKRRRLLILILLPLLLLCCLVAGVCLMEYRRLRDNRALTAAVKADDTQAALTALQGAAEADLPHQDDAPRSPWLRWCYRILGRQPNRNVPGPSLLAQSVQHNNTTIAKALLEKGAIDVNGEAPRLRDQDTYPQDLPLLSLAAEAGNLPLCQLLISHGAHVDGAEGENAGSVSPLKMAAAEGHSDVIRLLFQHGAKLDKPFLDDYALLQAAHKGDAESVRLLLEPWGGRQLFRSLRIGTERCCGRKQSGCRQNIGGGRGRCR